MKKMTAILAVLIAAVMVMGVTASAEAEQNWLFNERTESYLPTFVFPFGYTNVAVMTDVVHRYAIWLDTKRNNEANLVDFDLRFGGVRPEK